ncbi:MAG: Alpha-ketoglutarate-dependent taurine dioxygenase [Alphaproteobacteria bacterium MarineAlpha11_Bin1]|nr:MAG: Alpha-ketoglutarate-dependent taurine dioxygenase [Alphaproteobacteria bacterium MarineAlpha11_Bin1]|tara:strand:+ start:641 stop:1474 length:834 start_codon:yes stop_codon:yes gene_type:complete
MDGAGPGAAYQAITVKPYSPAIGAEIGNVDLTKPLTDLELDEIRRAFTEHMVLFFRDQEISFDDHARFGEYFGTLGQHVGKRTNSQATDDIRVRKFYADGETPRVSGNVWHTDQSCAPIPPLASVLYLHTLPPNGGGDTGFASMYAAYDALSQNMKDYLDGLTAHHDGTRQFGAGTPEANHPVVVSHPESGRKLLYVNEAFTAYINEVSREESKAILEFLYDHQKRPEWSTRFRWEPHSIAFWDNRCVHHRAISDYLPHVRSGYRIQVEGTEPPVAG